MDYRAFGRSLEFLATFILQKALASGDLMGQYLAVNANKYAFSLQWDDQDASTSS